MARKHGWQLPLDKLQIVAIVVFFLLVVEFYALFVPYLGKQILEYVAMGTYTPVAFAVFILYIRCSSINTADPGTFRSSLDDRSNRGGLAAGDTNIDVRSSLPRSLRSCLLGGLVCALFVKDDCRKFDDSENQIDGEEVMLCTLCNALVHKLSKHCGSCDKCVNGFDHHCQWLNNCVGRKNYFTFLALITTGLLLLAIQIGVGIAVIVICFTNKNSERIIDGKLGNGLPRPAFATIVVFSTFLSLSACLYIGHIFSFHMLLIRKGITSYEFVVAMRAMSEEEEPPREEEDMRTMSDEPPPEEEGMRALSDAPSQAEEDQKEENIVYSPTNSATTRFNGASSLGLLNDKGSSCTPPNIFADKDEVIPNLEPVMVPSSSAGDPDPAGHAERANKAKAQVKISAWKLAKLDSNEAMKAAAKARASSSVLRPVHAPRGSGSSLSSSGNASMIADYNASATNEKWT